MNEVAELELPTQENIRTDLRSVFQGAIRVALELILEEEIRSMVGANTLGVALGERGGAVWKIQHTANARERLEEAGKAFRQMKTTVDMVMPVPMDDGDHRRLQVEREKVVQLFDTTIGIERLRGTAWAAFQGWTEYADHHRLVRNTGRQDPRKARLESIWMGRSAAMKQAALTAITSQVGIQLAAA